MRKLLSFFLVLGMFININAEESISTYMPTISGGVTSVFKIQESYQTPLDSDITTDRSGASNRDSQINRTNGYVNVSSGIPGESQFFAVATITLDANSADNIDDFEYNGDIGDSESNMNNESQTKVDVSNLFVMWRPLEINGGRPLGISLGQQTIKATANPAYSHVFGGDLDYDYILNVLAIVADKPMVNVDFHITPQTGIGYAFSQGANDMIQQASYFDNEYSTTQTVYAELGLLGININAAFQMINGNSVLIDDVETEAGNTYYVADYGYTAYTLNGQINYNIAFGDTSFMPFAGYQMVWGEQAPVASIQTANIYDIKEVEVNVISLGGVISSKVMDKKVKLAGSYNMINTPDFEGLTGLQDGSLAAFGITDSLANVIDYNKSVFSFAGLDAMYNVQASVDVTDNFTLSIFLHGTLTKKLNLDSTEAITDVFVAQAIADTYTAYGVVLTEEEAVAAVEADATAQATIPVYAAMIDDGYSKAGEWTDNMSFGVSLEYRF